MNPEIFADFLEGQRLAKEQKKTLTSKERKFSQDQEDLLKMGIRLLLTDAQVSMAQTIKDKMDVQRYGKKLA